MTSLIGDVVCQNHNKSVDTNTKPTSRWHTVFCKAVRKSSSTLPTIFASIPKKKKNQLFEDIVSHVVTIHAIGLKP